MKISKLFFLMMSFALIFGCSKFDVKITKTDLKCGAGNLYEIKNTSKESKIKVQLKVTNDPRYLINGRGIEYTESHTLNPGGSKYLCSWQRNIEVVYQVESEKILNIIKKR